MWAEEGEKPTKYFCSLESRNYVNRIIPQAVKEDGTSVKKDILNEVKNFYKNYMVALMKTKNKIQIYKIFQFKK